MHKMRFKYFISTAEILKFKIKTFNFEIRCIDNTFQKENRV